MEASQIYIAISIAALAVIALLVVFSRKIKKQKLSPLAGLAFGFVLVGIFIGESRLVGYSLIGIGIVLAVIDMITKMKKRKR